MAPGDRAIDMIFDALHEEEIEKRVGRGEHPMEAMWKVWGKSGLRWKLQDSRLRPLVKLACLAALDEHETREALSLASDGATPYRTAPTLTPPLEAAPGGVWARLRAWAGRLRGRAGQR